MRPVPVFVLNWNASSMTARCLAHLSAQTYQDLRIVVLDNGSEPDDIRQLRQLEQQYAAAEFYYSPHNLGFTRAHLLMYDRWMGAHPDTDYVLLLNNDAFADAGWASALISKAHKERAGLVSSVMLQERAPERIDNVGHVMLNTGEILPHLSGTLHASMQGRLPASNHGPCAGAALYSVALIEEIGFFDPFFVTGYEDAELGIRAWLTGFSPIVAEAAIVHHVGSFSIDKLPRQPKLDKVQVDILYTMLKLMPWPVIAMAAPWYLIKYTLVLFINSLFGRWSLVRSLIYAWGQMIGPQRQEWVRARAHFMKKHKQHLLPSWKIVFGLRFFLMTDIRRFIRLLSGR